MADSLDVVAVGITHERSVVVRVVLGPDAGFVQHFRTGGDGRIEEGSNGCPVGDANAMCDSRKPSPESNTPSQKSGFSGVPYPMATPKSICRLTPSGASTAS